MTKKGKSIQKSGGKAPEKFIEHNGHRYMLTPSLRFKNLAEEEDVKLCVLTTEAVKALSRLPKATLIITSCALKLASGHSLSEDQKSDMNKALASLHDASSRWQNIESVNAAMGIFDPPVSTEPYFVQL